MEFNKNDVNDKGESYFRLNDLIIIIDRSIYDIIELYDVVIGFIELLELVNIYSMEE